MSTKVPQVSEIEALVNIVIADEPEYFIVDISCRQDHSIKVFMEGDNGITIEKCVQFNRQLRVLIEEKEWFDTGDFSLEVSSPGLETPLLQHRQYIRNIGKDVQVTFHDNTQKEGKLTEVTDKDIIIEYKEGKGKKAEVQQLVIPINNIKSTIVLIKF